MGYAYAPLPRRSLPLTTAIAPFLADVCLEMALDCPTTTPAYANAVSTLLHKDVFVMAAGFWQPRRPEEKSTLRQVFLTAGAS